jgi:hypothetical protein
MCRRTQTGTAYHPRTGDITVRHSLTSDGYTTPIVADVVGDSTPESIVVDSNATVSVLGPNGRAVWAKQLDSYRR